MLTVDSAAIFLKYIYSPSSFRMSSNGLLMLLLKVSADGKLARHSAQHPLDEECVGIRRAAAEPRTEPSRGAVARFLEKPAAGEIVLRDGGVERMDAEPLKTVALKKEQRCQPDAPAAEIAVDQHADSGAEVDGTEIVEVDHSDGFFRGNQLNHEAQLAGGVDVGCI